MILLSDSMVTLRAYTDQGNEIVSSFEHATKLVELCSDDFPAAAMVSGAATLGDTLVGTLLQKASRSLDAKRSSIEPLTHRAIVAEIVGVINPPYDSLVQAWRKQTAARLSALDNLAQLNEEREAEGFSLDETTHRA